MVKKLRFLAPICITLTLVTIFYFKRIVLIKFYPPIMNFFMFSVFFISLFTKETVIQRFVKLIDKNYNELVAKYTRNLTYVWCVFTFINFLISVITLFLPNKYWIAYNGFISYFCVGCIFVIEYPIRVLFRRRHGLQ